MGNRTVAELSIKISMALAFGLVSPNASADLEVLRGGLAVYDTDRNITWVADANLCATLGNCFNGDAEGGMRWIDALKWAYELDYLGYRDWRLPTAMELDGSGPNAVKCPSSEMGHLFCVELGGDPNNQGPFKNIQRSQYASGPRYWSREHIGISSPAAGWIFEFNGGSQAYEAFGGDDDFLFAWAVRKGRIEDVVTLASLTLNKTTAAGCLNVIGTIRLAAEAPAAGLIVSLSDTLNSATAPAAVYVPGGATSKTFTVTTLPVASSETGTVSASLDGTTLSEDLTLRPIGMASITLTPTTVVGGNAVAGTAKLECKASPGGISVWLSSSDAAVANATVPSIVVPAGVQSVSFTVLTSPVAVTAKPKITGTANGIAKYKALIVSPP